MARREKKPVHKVVMTEGKGEIIQHLIQEYDIETAEDIKEALNLLGGTIKEMIKVVLFLDYFICIEICMYTHFFKRCLNFIPQTVLIKILD